MKKKSNLILHIGSEKTGSTSIQSWLVQNYLKLERHGIIPVYKSDSGNFRELPAAFSTQDDYYLRHGLAGQSFEDFRGKLRDALSRDLEILSKTQTGHASSSKLFVISSELLSSRVRIKQEINMLYEFLSEFFDEIQVVFYFRDQATLAESSWSTHLKSGGTRELLISPGKTVLDPYFNLRALLMNWRSVVPKKSLFVYNFRLETARYQAGIVGHFKSVLERTHSVSLDTTSDDVGFLNTRLSYGHALALLWFNKCLIGRVQDPFVAHRLRQDFLQSLPMESEVLDIRVDRLAYRREFRASNSWLENHFPSAGPVFPGDDSFYTDLLQKQSDFKTQFEKLSSAWECPNV